MKDDDTSHSLDANTQNDNGKETIGKAPNSPKEPLQSRAHLAGVYI